MGPAVCKPKSTPEPFCPIHQNNVPTHSPSLHRQPITQKSRSKSEILDDHLCGCVSPCNYRFEVSTLARNTPASITDFMCLSQPEFSKPIRQSLMEGDFIEHTAKNKGTTNHHFIYYMLKRYNQHSSEHKVANTSIISLYRVNIAYTSTNVKACPLTLQQFLQAVSHDVDIFNSLEVEPDIGVVVLILIAFTSCAVRHCIQLAKTKNVQKYMHTFLQMIRLWFTKRNNMLFFQLYW